MASIEYPFHFSPAPLSSFSKTRREREGEREGVDHIHERTHARADTQKPTKTKSGGSLHARVKYPLQQAVWKYHHLAPETQWQGIGGVPM